MTLLKTEDFDSLFDIQSFQDIRLKTKIWRGWREFQVHKICASFKIPFIGWLRLEMSSTCLQTVNAGGV